MNRKYPIYGPLFSACSAGRLPVTPDEQPDFVALAVSAMREYSDENDRNKVRGATADAALEVAEPLRSPLKGLQHTAAKVNVFA